MPSSELNADPLARKVTNALGSEYRLTGVLGQGGMARVYLAEELALRRLVAIKVLDPELAAVPSSRARFQREAETAAQLHHPHIVPIYRVGEKDDVAYFTMAAVEGDDLGRRIAAQGALPRGEAVRIAREIATALAAAHKRGIIHRDIKPQNILLDRDSGRVLVTDFGIARSRELSGEDRTEEDLTLAGMVMGTPRYLSPEQAEGGRELSPAADLYSLGVLMYEMLTGRYPYQTTEPQGGEPRPFSARDYLMAHLTQDPVPLVAHQGDFPQQLETVVMRLLAKEPDQRYGSAEELIEALDAWQDPKGPAEVRKPPLSGRRRLATAAVLLLATAVAIRGLLGGNDGPPAGVDPRHSILLGFFSNTTGDPEADWLRVGSVELLSQSLTRWEDLQVVGSDRLLDLARREGIEDGVSLSRDDAIRLARAAKVWTATTGSILPLGSDSVRLSVRVYDVQSGRELTQAVTDAGLQGDFTIAFDQLANQLLQLAGAPRAAMVDLEPPTRSLDAFRVFVAGIEARSRFEIDSAEASFSRALELDPTFAMAYYELSQVRLLKEAGVANPTYPALADSAVRYARERSAKEQQLTQAYRAFVQADLPRAATLYRALLARDSSMSDAWLGLGRSVLFDMTLQADGDGVERYPLDPTTSWRSFHRALELDRSDYRVYPLINLLLMAASQEDDGRFPAFRDPPPGPLYTIGNRRPVKWYTLLLVGDSLVVVPSDSVSLRYGQRLVDSLRSSARQQAEVFLQDWLTLAPDQSAAWLNLALVQHLESKYQEGLNSLAEAERLGWPSVIPYPVVRLMRLLEARLFEQAGTLTDSLMDQERFRAPTGQTAVFSAGALSSAMISRGRIDEATRLAEAQLAASVEGPLGESLTDDAALAPVLGRARLKSSVDRLEPADVQAVLDTMDALAARMGDSLAAEFHRRRRWQLLLFQALLGDTAEVARLRERHQMEGRVALDGWAAVVAGDPVKAEELYRQALSDTSSSPTAVFYRARLAEALGHQPYALDSYRQLDTLSYNGGGPDPDFAVLVRSYAFRAGVFEALNSADSAVYYYRKFLNIWNDPDSTLRDERDLARQRLAELERVDRTD